MSDRESNFTVWGFVKGFAKLIIGLLLVLQGLIGLVILLLIVGVFVSVSNGLAGNNDDVSVSIPADAALVIDPSGVLVEKAEDVDPFELIIEEAYGVDEPRQIEVHEIVRVIRKAKDDDRIKGIVLDIGELNAPSRAASKIHYISAELKKFKDSGKKVIAIGDYYSQDQYLIAANADEIYMNDYGNVVIYGYGRYSTYVKSLLEKLKITSHVFRVGTFKSAVEPFIRDDMSEEAKQANRAYLGILWDEYKSSVESSRGLPAGSIENYANNLSAILENVNGDFAAAAVESGLVDELKTRAEITEHLMGVFGKDKSGKNFKNVSYNRYLAALEDAKDDGDPNVALVTAAGVIVDGEAPAGQAAGGDSIAALLKKARRDENVKAVVLRVDSPGGSAFASDIIRDELLAIKAAGKPLVVSMGSLAASGGYWIAADADEIWAAPTTITGSIGIFGYFNTFENSAAEIGVYVDGVGTTNLSPILATGLGPLPETASQIIQQSIENGYDRFLTVVGNGRNLEKSYVDSVGQGRVWIAGQAQERRLVDNIGGIDEAIASAAKRAGLEKYDVVEMGKKPTPFERLLRSMTSEVLAMVGIERSVGARNQSALQKLTGAAKEQVEFFEQFNDPNATYARCLACD